MKRNLPIAAAVVVIGGFLFWYLSTEQVLKRRTEKLLSVLTFEEKRSMMGSQMGSYSLNALVAKELVLESPSSEANGNFGRDQIESGFAWLGGQAKFTQFEVKEFQAVTVNGNLATVEALIDGVVALSEYRPVDGLYQVTLDWQKEDDGWKLAKAKWVEAVK